MPLVLSGRYDGPRMARPGEGAEILRFVSRIFPGHPSMGRGWSMVREYPHMYGDMEAHPEWCFVVRHAGRIVSHCGVYPLEFVSGGRRVMCGGIGAVATDPAFRGRGMMAALLGYCTEYMRRNGMPVSILWGDRVRYARFGWEPAGRELAFHLHRGAAAILRRWDERVVEVRDTDSRAGELQSLHRACPVRVERDPATFRLILRKFRRRVFAAVRGRRITAYALARPGVSKWDPSWSVDEVAGSPGGVLSLFRWLASRPGVRRVSGVVPVAPVPYLRELFAATDSWSTSMRFLGQIKVVDRASLLSAFGVRALDRVVARSRPGKCGEARLLFGPLPPAALVGPVQAAVLSRRMPLPFFLWPTDHV